MSEREIYDKVLEAGILRKHNIDAYVKVVRMFETEDRVCIEHATGTGKSFIALQLMFDQRNKKITYLVPRNGIGDQIEEHIMSLSEDARKKYFPNVEIRTYQSLLNMTREELNNLDIDYLITDEYHHLGSPEWGGRIDVIISSHPNLKIFGMTATSTRGLGTTNEEDMSQTFFNGNVASRLTLADAIAKGILKAPKYVTAYYNFDDEITRIKDNIEKKNINKETKNEYLREIETLRKKAKMLVSNAPSFNDILKENLKSNGKYIVFCPRSKLNETMNDATQWLTKITNKQNIKTYFSTSSKIKESRINQEKFYNDHDSNKLRVMFAMDMYNEGIHVPDIDGVIMLRPSKSDIIFYQQLGRALACNPEAERPLVIDFVNNIYQIRSLLNEIKNSKEKNGNDIIRVGHDADEDSSIYFDIDVREIKLLDQLLEFENKLSLSVEERIKEFIEFLNEGLSPTSNKMQEKEFSNGDKVGMFWGMNQEKIIESFNTNLKYRDSKYDTARNILYKFISKKVDIDKIAEIIEFLNEGLYLNGNEIPEKRFSNGNKVGYFGKNQNNRKKIIERFNADPKYRDSKYDTARNRLYEFTKEKVDIDKIAEFIEILNEGLSPTSNKMQEKEFSNGDKVSRSFWGYNKEKVLERFNTDPKYRDSRYDTAKNILYPENIDKIAEVIEFLNEGLPLRSTKIQVKYFSNGEKVGDFGKGKEDILLERLNGDPKYQNIEYDMARNMLKKIDKIAEIIEIINNNNISLGGKAIKELKFSNGKKIGLYGTKNKEKVALRLFNESEYNTGYYIAKNKIIDIARNPSNIDLRKLLESLNIVTIQNDNTLVVCEGIDMDPNSYDEKKKEESRGDNNGNKKQ